MNYYSDKIDSLRDIFGEQDVELRSNELRVGTKVYPIVDDVIVLLAPRYQSPQVRARLNSRQVPDATEQETFSEAVQFTFGRQWQKFEYILPEHEREFYRYFDLVDLTKLTARRCADIGCGIGRWSHFLAPKCKEIVLLDFSDAIFVARKNLRNHNNALFFMGDLTAMPFRSRFADLLFSLGVLHHLPKDCLDLTRSLAPYADSVLIYLYYALDNRPFHFRALYWIMEYSRRLLCHLRNEPLRQAISYALVIFGYWPLVGIGHLLSPFGIANNIPLYEYYRDKSFERTRQDAYDRFFTAIEQRVSRIQIEGLRDTFSDIRIADRTPYWRFLASSNH